MEDRVGLHEWVFAGSFPVACGCLCDYMPAIYVSAKLPEAKAH